MTDDTMPAVGQPAPAFTLLDDSGTERSLEDERGRWLVLFFYPTDFTPGCTTEVCDFRDRTAEFEAALYSLGTPRFEEVYRASLEQAEPIKRAAYSVAYMDGVVVALVLSGIVGIIGAGMAWLLMGRRDPINAVFDMQDERAREDYVPTGMTDPTDED